MSKYRHSRPVTAALLLSGPFWVPLALVGIGVVTVARDVPEVIVDIHREAKAGLKWSIVEPVQALASRIRAKLSAGRKEAAERVEEARWHVSDLRYGWGTIKEGLVYIKHGVIDIGWSLRNAATALVTPAIR